MHDAISSIAPSSHKALDIAIDFLSTNAVLAGFEHWLAGALRLASAFACPIDLAGAEIDGHRHQRLFVVAKRASPKRWKADGRREAAA